MIEAIAEHDDELMAAWVAGRELAAEQIRDGAPPRDARRPRRADARRRRVPATRASTTCSTRCSTTCRRPPTSARSAAATSRSHRRADDRRARSATTQPLAALAFKVQIDDAGGQLTFVRVYTGLPARRRRGAQRDEGPPRADRPPRADVREPPRGHSPDRGRHDRRGRSAARSSRPATRSAIRARRSCSIAIAVPNPVMGIVVEPETDEDHAKLAHALERLAIEDPSFRVTTDPDSGQIVISRDGRAPPRDRRRPPAPRVRRQGARRQPAGRLPRDRHPPRRGREQVRPRQLGARAASTATSGSSSSRPTAAAATSTRIARPPSDIPQEHAPAVEAGVTEAVERGVLAGHPMTDLRVQVVGGSYHPVDSNNYAFKVAGSKAFVAAANKAGPDAARAGHVARGRNSRRVRRRRPRRFACQTRKSRWNYRRGLVYKPSPVLSPWPRCSVTRPTSGPEPEAARLTRWNSTTTQKFRSKFATT